MIASMQIRQAVRHEIAAHALADLPNECCGLLIGSEDLIERAVPARNVRASPTRFLVDPEDHFAALRQARAAGLVVCGAYHSHPRGPSAPSATDRAEMHDPTLLHLIVDLSSGGPEIRAFGFRDGAFHPVTLVPVP